MALTELLSTFLHDSFLHQPEDPEVIRNAEMSCLRLADQHCHHAWGYGLRGWHCRLYFNPTRMPEDPPLMRDPFVPQDFAGTLALEYGGLGWGRAL